MQNIKVCCFIVRSGGFYLENPLNESTYELMDELKSFFATRNKDLATYLSQKNFFFKLAYLCNIFAKLNRLNIFIQGPDKNMLDISNKIAAFI